MKRNLTGFFLTLAAIASCAIAAHGASLKEGTQEFSVGGAFEPKSSSGADFNVKLTYGFFAADNLEVGGRIGYHNNDETTLFSAGPFTELNFDLGGEFVPFIGAELDFAHGDSSPKSNDGLALTGYGGGKYFLAENVAITAKLDASWATEKIYAKKKGADSTNIEVEFGMSFYIP